MTDVDDKTALVGRLDVRPGELAGIQEVFEAARSSATRRAYASDWKVFSRFCDEHAVPALPASSTTVVRFLEHLRQLGRARSSIERMLVTIAVAHDHAGVDNPRQDKMLREYMKGLRRLLRSAPRRAAPPLLVEDLVRVVDAQPSTPAGLRNRALLLVGWFGALRRSELVALDRSDVRVETAGLVLRIRSSKTDQEGEGDVVGIPRTRDKVRCPVLSLERWLQVQDAGDALFVALDHRCRGQRLAAQAVERILFAGVARAGLAGRFTPHSLRAGFATGAARAGKAERTIRRQTRHRSLTTLHLYIREGDVFRENAGDGLL